MDAYLWLLPVLLPAVAFFFGNCPCCGCVEGTIVSERVGDGEIVLFGDSNVLKVMNLENNQLAENLLELVKLRSGESSPVVNCLGVLSHWRIDTLTPIPFVTPTAVADEADLEGVHCLWTGVPPNYNPPDAESVLSYLWSDSTAIRAWLDAGGVLLCVAENDFFYDALNGDTSTALAGLNVKSRVLDGSWDNPAGGPPIEGTINPDHPLIDGTIGDPVTEIYHAATCTVSGTQWAARTASGALKPDGSAWSTECFP